MQFSCVFQEVYQDLVVLRIVLGVVRNWVVSQDLDVWVVVVLVVVLVELPLVIVCQTPPSSYYY
jgi:hypothetical protein